MKATCSCGWIRQFLFVVFSLLWHGATPMQAYSQDTLLTITVVDTQGVVMANVDLILMRDSTLVAQMKTGSEGQARSTSFGPGWRAILR